MEKEYVLTDGSKWTVREIAQLTGVALQTARNRLQQSRNPYQVLARKGLQRKPDTSEEST